MSQRLEPPSFVEPMAAQVVDRLPEGDDWVYEVKFDGYRALLIKNADNVQIRSRNNKNLTHAYPTVQSAGLRLRARSAVVDGEIVAVDATGRPSFQALQHPAAHRDHTVMFYGFDLLHLNGRNLTACALEERRRELPGVLESSGVLLSEPLHGSADQITEAVRSLGLEGVIAKRRSSVYNAGQRGPAWVKLKLDQQQEFVVGGYRPGPNGIDSLLVGVYTRGQLHFAGKVRAGFTPHTRREIFARLKPLRTNRCPFSDLPNTRAAHWGGGVTTDQMSEMQWTEPRIVAQIRFVEWTEEGHLRHASYIGLRDDKGAGDVHKESIRPGISRGAPVSGPERRARSASRNSSRRKA